MITAKANCGLCVNIRGQDVTIQRIVAGLGLSQSGIEFLVCSEVSFSGGLESFSQVGPMAM